MNTQRDFPPSPAGFGKDNSATEKTRLIAAHSDNYGLAKLLVRGMEESKIADPEEQRDDVCIGDVPELVPDMGGGRVKPAVTTSSMASTTRADGRAETANVRTQDVDDNPAMVDVVFYGACISVGLVTTALTLQGNIVGAAAVSAATHPVLAAGIFRHSSSNSAKLGRMVAGGKATNEKVAALEKKMDDGFKRTEKKMDDGFKRTDDKIEKLEKKMDDGFKRCDEKFVALEKKMDDGFKRYDEKFVALEKKMDDGFKRYDEKFVALEKKMDDGFAAANERFAGIDERLNGVDHRLNGIDERLGRMDDRLDRVENRLDGIEERLDGIEGRLDGIDGALARIEEMLRRPETSQVHVIPDDRIPFADLQGQLVSNRALMRQAREEGDSDLMASLRDIETSILERMRSFH